MIHFYTWATPNGRKVSILLEELGLPYQTLAVNLGRGEQFAPDFQAISPNNKIPAIIDQGLSVFESGAILQYLAEKYGRFLPAQGAARYKALEWLHWQMGGLGPMVGQLAYFEKFAAAKSAEASARFLAESKRLLQVLEHRLSETTWLAGEDYTIADMAAYPWVVSAATFLAEQLQAHVAQLPAVGRWMAAMAARPAVQRGMAVPQL